jgi:UDP-2,3-diacylglucosamine hydrolase
MFHKPLVLQEGAIIVSDAHYSELRPDLLALLEQIHSQKLLTSQLVLMGDIFDALFGDVAYTQRKNQKIIRLLNEISMKVEVIYLEGNHDFNLKEYFHHMQIFPQKQQPVVASYEGKKVLLAHGDFDGSWSYKLYCKLIRNRFLVKFLTLVDTVLKNKILKKLDAYLAKKEDCREFVGFEEFILKRNLQRYKGDYFI